MTYHLFVTVNAAGVPYQDTFNADKEASWFTHWWRDVPKDGYTTSFGSQACKGETGEKHRASLRANGDRVVPVTVTTHEIVTTEIHLDPQ